MALYKDGNPVSGLNSVPELTLAQYNALNVKPKFWVRTDAPESYKKLSADQVSYDSNNTVKDKIDKNEVKYKEITYSNFGNSDTTKYYVTLSDNPLNDIGDNATVILSTTIATFSGYSNFSNIILPNVVLDEGKLLTIFQKGGTFSGLSLRVRFAYK